MKIKEHHLSFKGWTKEEIEKANAILERAEIKKKPNLKLLELSLFWIALLMAVAINFVFSIFAIPFILAIKGLALYFIIVIVGLCLGMLFTVLVRDIEHMEAGHHILLSIIVVITAIINFFLIANILEKFIQQARLVRYHDPLTVAIVYIIAFLTPYIFFMLEKGKK